VQWLRQLRSGLRQLRRDTMGSNLLEFAVALPLLVVFVIGMFDFGTAFNLKQKLNNTVRGAARFGSSLPTDDLTQPTPSSVLAMRDDVERYLVSAQINDCALGSSVATASGTLAWTFTANSGCPGTLTLTIERGYSFPVTVTNVPNPVNVISTHVTISYPFAWHFNNVIQLLVKGATYAGVTQISTDAIIPNPN
jgi:Flp pilus assembly protein TadG